MAFIAKPVKPGTHADKSKRKRVHESADGAKVLHKKAKIDTSTSASKLAAKSDLNAVKSKGTKRNAALIQDITAKWEKLRHPDTTAAQRIDIVHEILTQVQGRVADLAMSHTASRVIQACAKHGNETDRKALLAEAAPRVVGLAKSSYGHFLLCKLISAATKAQFPEILKMFKGHIAQLLRHPCGAAVIDDLYNEATRKQQGAMAAELYGREYVLFSGEAKRLPDLMKELPAAKQKAVLRNMAQHAIPIMEKALVDPPLVHRMLAEYIAASPGRSVSEAVQLLSGPPLVRLVHTKEGAQVACAVITYGTAKDRKKAIKGLAGQADSIFKMAQDEFGHVVLLCILDTVDDTALLKKQILPELQNNLSELIKSKPGRRIILQLLHPNQQKYVPLHLQHMAHPPPKPASGSEILEDQEQVGDTLGGSKKNSELRRQEILGEGPSSFAGLLCKACKSNAADMLRDPQACDVIVEVAQAGSSGVLTIHHSSAVHEVQEAIAQAATPTPSISPKAGEEEHVLLNYFSSRAMRRLIVASSHHASEDGASTDFLMLLWEAAIKGRCQQWLGTHAEKILAALATCNNSTISNAMEIELQPILGKSVEQWAADFVQHGSEMSKLPIKKRIKKHSVS
ncbi:TPA: hypothetical protein ACH3X3_013804 [Trebouxia sp. C0006]